MIQKLCFPGMRGRPNKPRVFKCIKCCKLYWTNMSLRRHLKYECGIEPKFCCLVCGRKFRHNFILKAHHLRHKKDSDIAL